VLRSVERLQHTVPERPAIARMSDVGIPGVGDEIHQSRAFALLSLELATLAGPLTALGAAAMVAPLAAANGGYFPTAWGWAAVPFAWTAGLALVVRRHIRLHPLELVFLGTLGLLTAWIGLSLLWSRDFPQSVLELERVLVYLSGTLAAALVLRRRAVPWLVGGLGTAVACVCAYALATRLFPSATGVEAIVVNRLQTPIGYWNALGIFAAIGALLLVGLAARAKWVPGRALAAAGTVVCVTTLYFTFSRGSWLALFVGIVVALAVDPRRLQLSVSLLVLAPFSAAAVLFASRSSELVDLNRPLSQTTADGHRVALAVVLLAAGTAGAVLLQHVLAARWRPDRTIRVAYVAAIVLAVVVAAGVALAHYGGPASAARRAWHSFRGAPVQVGAGQSLSSRLFSFSSNGRVDMWTAAWHDFEQHPALGSGAGSFEQYWYAHRNEQGTVRDAHSLYMETFAELGIIGLVLLAVLLVTPLVALVRVRAHRLASALAAGYVAFLVHAAVDWDWEIPAVVLLALLTGVGLLALGRDRTSPRVGLAAGVAVALLVLVPVAGFSLYTLIGNRRLSAAGAAIGRGDWQQARSEARASVDWSPWAASPWHALAAADAALGRRAQAVRDMREAVKAAPRDWTLWIDLGNVSTGAERRQAYARARQLNPREAGIPKA
jgi:O-Antigen ligase